MFSGCLFVEFRVKFLGEGYLGIEFNVLVCCYELVLLVYIQLEILVVFYSCDFKIDDLFIVEGIYYLCQYKKIYYIWMVEKSSYLEISYL